MDRKIYFSINIDQTDQEKFKITTMDTLRFFNWEIEGYITVTRIDDKSNLPEYPNFLKKRNSYSCWKKIQS